jgi:hypothetical protein
VDLHEAENEGVVSAPSLRAHFDLGAGVVPQIGHTIRRHETITYEEAEDDDS